jgi:predicted NAD/FAD-binding protein
MAREWNTPVRECWNAPIHQILKAIDNHTRLYLKTGDPWHLEVSTKLRSYLHELKTWIHEQEGKTTQEN